MYPPFPDVGPALGILRRRAEALCAALLERAPSGSIVAVFVGGSVARGEVWAARINGTWEIYSDIDLYVVVRGADARARVRSLAAGVGDRTAADAGEALLLRPAEIGVYTVADLRAQPARPGTLDLAARAIWLYGDRGILGQEQPLDARSMARDEALYLLENRVTELTRFATGGEAARERLARVLAWKTRLDVATAHLIANGAFDPTLVGRMRSLRAARPATMTAEELDDVAEAFGRFSDLSSRLGEGEWEQERERALGAACAAWLAIARMLMGGGDAGRLLHARCAGRGRLDNCREYVRMRRSAGASRAEGIASALRLSRYSARTVLRTRALAGVLRNRSAMDRRFDEVEHFVDRLTRAMGFTQGSIDTRAAAALDAMA